jgi:hypothetical protein
MEKKEEHFEGYPTFPFLPKEASYFPAPYVPLPFSAFPHSDDVTNFFPFQLGPPPPTHFIEPSQQDRELVKDEDVSDKPTLGGSEVKIESEEIVKEEAAEKLNETLENMLRLVERAAQAQVIKVEQLRPEPVSPKSEQLPTVKQEEYESGSD